MANTFKEGLFTGFGFLLALLIVSGLVFLITKLAKHISREYDKYKIRAKFVLDNWKTYEKKGYFEELAILSKHKEKLAKGEWPDELEGMFEWVDTDKAAETDYFGNVRIYRKSILALKAKYKPTAPKKDDGNMDSGNHKETGNNEDQKDEETK